MPLLPKISIVTPSFNQGSFIEETIDSVLSQGYHNLEYIVIDGGSTDASVEIIKRYEKHLHYWVSEPDAGQTDAINKGLARSTGVVFNWLNSDDYLAAGALRCIGEAFENPNLNVLIGRSRVFAGEKTLFETRGADIYPGNLAKTMGRARIDQPESYFRKSCVDALAPLNENLHYLMDRDLWFRYLHHYGLEGIQRMDRILVNFRLHGDSKTVSHQSDFERERNSYYHSLANSGGQKQIAAIIAGIGEIQPLNIDPVHDPSLLQSVLHHFLALLAEDLYRQNKRRELQTIMREIDFSLLDEKTVATLRKINFRNQYLPLWLIRLLRKR